MGKGSIVSGGVDGHYTVKLDTGKATQTARLARLDARLVELLPLITRAQGLLSVQQVLEALAEAAVAPSIEAYVAASRANPIVPAALKASLDAFSAAMVKLNAERLKTAPLRLDLEALKSEQTQAIKDRAKWAALVLEITQQAWCADLTEDATGVVATIEIPGESKLVLIAPEAPAPTAADGVLTAREVQTPEQVFWNAAVLPGWQKFKPTYRRGTVTAIHATADTADVTLDDDRSSAQKLGINKFTELTAVPVVYMTCNSGAFEVGDKCVVKFTGGDWAQPKIVGFVDHPKACAGVLSGVVRDGTLVTLDGPPSVQALHSYKPTQQAWQYQLRRDPATSPDAYHDEPKLAPNGLQMATLSPALWSGRMAKAVAVIMGRARAVLYKYHWLQCHGIVLGADGKPWLLEISAAAGVMAMRLPVDKARATSPQDVERACFDLFGGVPSGESFPTGTAMLAARAAGKVIQLADPSALADFYGKQGYSTSCGWSFSDTGAEAHNTCYTVDAEENAVSYHYKIAISISALVSPVEPNSPIATGTATLTLVESGPLLWTAIPPYWDYHPSPISFYEPTQDRFELLPGRIFREGAPELEIPLSTPVFVCHINGVLDVVRVKSNATSAYTIEGERIPILASSYLSTEEKIRINNGRFAASNRFTHECNVTRIKTTKSFWLTGSQGVQYYVYGGSQIGIGKQSYFSAAGRELRKETYQAGGAVIIQSDARDCYSYLAGEIFQLDGTTDSHGIMGAWSNTGYAVHLWGPETVTVVSQFTPEIPNSWSDPFDFPTGEITRAVYDAACAALLAQNNILRDTDPQPEPVGINTSTRPTINIIPGAGNPVTFVFPDDGRDITDYWMHSRERTRPFQVWYSVFGPNPQIVYTTDQAIDGCAVAGSMLTDEPSPALSAYTFIGYI